jgi:dimethylhistidine N-methyltransferase
MSPKAPTTVVRAIADRDLEEIHYYLTQSPRQLPSRLLYDALGSTLFDAICLLPWYGITRAEMRLLVAHGASIGRRASPAELVELGCGNGQKLAALVRAMAPLRPDIHLIDVSREALDQATRLLRDADVARITLAHGTYEDGLMHLPSTPQQQRRLILFLGSNIGNFDPPGASAFLHVTRRAARRGDWLLLGVDLVKPERDLMLAYDDPLGVTAAFNKNLLLRLNAEAGTNFNLEEFRHEVRWNRSASRVEMHLVSRHRQDVVVPGSSRSLEFTLEPGERIWTESSYKYEPDGVRALVESCGFRMRCEWIDDEARFLLALFEAVT